MTAILDSTSVPEFQTPDLLEFVNNASLHQTDSSDLAIALWRSWREAVLIENEASELLSSHMAPSRRQAAAEHGYDLFNARVTALTALRRCRRTTPVALAARLHAAFYHAYAGLAGIDRRDPAFQAVAAMLLDLLPAVPGELAADITATLNGLGLAGEA